MVDHLAILKRTYLELILAGVKTIECRLTVMAKPPFGVLKKGQRGMFSTRSAPKILPRDNHPKVATAILFVALIHKHNFPAR